MWVTLGFTQVRFVDLLAEFCIAFTLNVFLLYVGISKIQIKKRFDGAIFCLSSAE